MTFKTYWDLEDKERAALSSADVERYLDVELMTKGVLRVVPPEFDPVPPEPELPKRTYCVCAGLVFETAEQAATLAALKPRIRQNRYLGGGYRSSIGYAADAGTEVTTEKLADEDAVVLASAQLDKRAAIIDSNDRKRETFEKESKEMSKVLDGVWDDWKRCRAKSAELRRVVDTFETYVRTAGGDRDIAAAFLAKAFDDETIKVAREWHGVDIPQGNKALTHGIAEAPPQPTAHEDSIAF